MPVMRMNHAVLYVRDVAVTREFYENALGKRDAMHTGIDYAVGPGTPIPAAAAGIVKAAEPNGGYGKWVLIEFWGFW